MVYEMMNWTLFTNHSIQIFAYKENSLPNYKINLYKKKRSKIVFDFEAFYNYFVVIGESIDLFIG